MERTGIEQSSYVSGSTGHDLVVLAQSVATLLPELDSLLRKLNVLNTIAALHRENRSRSNDTQHPVNVATWDVLQSLDDLEDLTREAQEFTSAIAEVLQQVSSLERQAELLKRRGHETIDTTESAIQQMEKTLGVTDDTYRRLSAATDQ